MTRDRDVTISPDQENENKEEPSFPTKFLLTMLFSFLSIALTALFLLTRAAFSEGKEYLYLGEDDPYFPIVDYAYPDNETLADDKGMYNYLHPDFLYKPDGLPDFEPPPRVVEFYAPWCPHCQHFKPHYIDMAKEIYSKQPKIKFYAVSCVAHHELCKKQDISGYPTVRVYKEGSYTSEEKENFSRMTAEKVLTKLGYDENGVKISLGNAKLLRKHDPVHVTLKPKKDSNIRSESPVKPEIESNAQPKIARVVPFHSHEVSDAWHDAAASFEFSLKYNIYMSNGPLSKKEQDAFLDWLELLADTLPPQMNRTLEIIKHILDNFSRATNGLPSLTDLISAKFPPLKTVSWRTCTYGENENGYTCGLWQLFHIMSVGLVEHNRHAKSPIPTRYVSETLRNYIEHFFQCDVCRMNFLSMYDSCAFDGCHRLSNNPSTSEQDWRELPMWLWETHNDVNVRLMGERLDRDSQPRPSDWESQQARWPSLYQCPDCWREDHSWEQDEVFQLLHSVYWVGNPTHIKIQSTDELLTNNNQSRVMSWSWKVAGIIFAMVLLAVWLVKSNHVLTMRGRRRKKKYKQEL